MLVAILFNLIISHDDASDVTWCFMMIYGYFYSDINFIYGYVMDFIILWLFYLTTSSTDKFPMGVLY